MSMGEIFVLLVYRIWKVFQSNISSCKTFWSPLVFGEFFSPQTWILAGSTSQTYDLPPIGYILLLFSIHFLRRPRAVN